MNFNILAWVSLAIVICNLYIVATSRLSGMIRGVAIQGLLLSTLPFLVPNPSERIHVFILVALIAVVKGIVIPGYLFKSIQSVRVVKITKPAIGYSLSVVFSICVTALSFYVL